MADAFRVDRERFLLATGPSDFASEVVDHLLRNPIAPADWDRLLLARMPDTRIVESAYDWETWLAAGRAGAPSPGAPVFHLLFRQQNVITSRRCSDLVAAMILAIESSTPFNDLVAMIAADSGATAGQRAMLRRQLQRQVGALSAAGIISVTIADQTRPTESVTQSVQVVAT